MNGKILSLVLLVLTLPVFAASEEAKLIAFSGTVEVRNTREGQWAPAAENMEIAEGGAVRAGSDGSAVVLMPNKTKVWIKESSSVEVEQRATLASRLALMFGKIKIRVPHLMRKEKFEVRTPSAVCAVRGTEFTVDTNAEGVMNINVLYGEVKLNFVVPPEKGSAELYIPQGRGMSLAEKGKPAKLALMTAEQEKSSLENWNPGLSPSDRRKEMQAKDNDRAQIREFARVTNGTENSVQSFLNNVKESDLEAGRTLRDLHGNLVRVDQRLMRPYPDEVQFINLVKRPEYGNNDSASAAAARGGFAYNGASMVSNRLDYLQMTMNFNKDLPQSIDEWPAFFNGNSIKAEWASFVTANRTSDKEIFFIAEDYKYDPARDELMNNSAVMGVPLNAANGGDREVLITGVIKDGAVKAADGLDNISRFDANSNLRVADSGAGDGTLKYTADNSLVNAGGGAGTSVLWAMKMNAPVGLPGGTNTYEKKGDPYLWQYQASPYAIGGSNANGHFWFTTETSVINNSGSVQQVEDFTKSSLDPFSILKNSAGEAVMSIKKDNGSVAPGAWTSANIYGDISQDDYFAYGGGAAGAGTNIDLVFVPDLLLAAVQRMLPAITNLNK
ncbi:MAG: FecR family protein [Elusimicrobiales bacterium]|jgi:hypothetical protein